MGGCDRRRRTGRDRLVVSVCGPSGSGKSSLAVGLVEALGTGLASRVPADWYLLDAPPGAATVAPYAWDWLRLTADLAGPDGRLVHTPRFDFARMRRGDPGSAKGFTLRPVMLVDAMRPYPAAGLVVRLEVGPDERRRRLAERDARWGTSVLTRWDRLEASHVDASPRTDGLVLDGESPPGELIHLVLGAIRRRFGDDLPASFPGDGLDAIP